MKLTSLIFRKKTDIFRIKEYSSAGELWYQFRKNKTAMSGFIIILIFIFIALSSNILSNYDPLKQNISERKLAPFTDSHILGTDDFGRDILTRIIYGTRISLLIGVISVSISLILGLLVGLFAGYFGGWFDKIIMRVMDIMLAFPYILLTIVIVATLGPSLPNAMIAIGISNIPQYALLIRSSVLAEKESEYVLAERSLGAGNMELLFKSILPNCLGPVIVQTTLGIGTAIIESAALSFLGLGAQPPTPEWGLMLASGKEFVANAWWIVTFPGIAILLAVLGFNLLGDGLRDILDPKMKE